MTEAIINSKAKIFTIFLFSITALGILAVSTQIAVWIFSEWYSLLAGIVLMIAAIPLPVQGNCTPIFYIYSFIANSIGGGFSVSAYYMCKHIPVRLSELLLGALPAAGILLLSYAVLQVFIKTKKFAILAAILVCVIFMIIDIILWIKTGSIFYSFGAFAILTAVVILILTEGSILDGADFGGDGKKKTAKKK